MSEYAPKIPNRPVKPENIEKGYEETPLTCAICSITIFLFFFYCIGSLIAFSFGAFNQKWDSNCDINTGGKVLFYPAYKAGCFMTRPIPWNKENT